VYKTVMYQIRLMKPFYTYFFYVLLLRNCRQTFYFAIYRNFQDSLKMKKNDSFC